MEERQEEPTPGKMILAARLERGWSAAKLARVLDTTDDRVRDWEAGRNFPSLPMWQRMSFLFGWSFGSWTKRAFLNDWVPSPPKALRILPRAA